MKEGDNEVDEVTFLLIAGFSYKYYVLLKFCSIPEWMLFAQGWSGRVQLQSDMEIYYGFPAAVTQVAFT